MPVYGYRTAKQVNYAAIFRHADGCSTAHTCRASSRNLAMVIMSREAQGGKIELFQSQDEMSDYDQERAGFITHTPRSIGRIDYDLATD